MSSYKDLIKRVGRYAISSTLIGIMGCILVLTARNIYQETIHSENQVLLASAEQKREYLAHENKLYGTVFSLGGLIGFIAGATIGFQRSKNHNDQEEHDECHHCHYHL